MELNELRDKIHENAKAKGFYDVENSIINFGIGTSKEKLIRHSLFAQKIAQCMGKCIEALLECDAIFMASGWINSKGCNAEFQIAKIYGIKIIE